MRDLGRALGTVIDLQAQGRLTAKHFLLFRGLSLLRTRSGLRPARYSARNVCLAVIESAAQYYFLHLQLFDVCYDAYGRRQKAYRLARFPSIGALVLLEQCRWRTEFFYTMVISLYYFAVNLTFYLLPSFLQTRILSSPSKRTTSRLL